jgi:hypothetical protein
MRNSKKNQISCNEISEADCVRSAAGVVNVNWNRLGNAPFIPDLKKIEKKHLYKSFISRGIHRTFF